jgi:hypothetical protein
MEGLLATTLASTKGKVSPSTHAKWVRSPFYNA